MPLPLAAVPVDPPAPPVAEQCAPNEDVPPPVAALVPSPAVPPAPTVTVSEEPSDAAATFFSA
jgi:hypothetical protein